MGLAITKERFEPEEYRRFDEHLRADLTALARLLERPGFGEGPLSIGSELEMSLVDPSGRPRLINERVLAEARDPRLTVELDRFNLECNGEPSLLAGRPMAALAGELESGVGLVRQCASRLGARVVCIGILPTLRASDLESSAMTNVPRYRALSAALRGLRGGRPFQVRIDGADPLEIVCDDVTFEGANTSLQIHLRVAPGDFADVYDAVQVATAPVLAAAGNSPTFLGHDLWAETRVALFKQSVDERDEGERGERMPRVCFGNDWLRDGALGLFRQSVEGHEPLLPVCDEEDDLARVASGEVPGLAELRLHHGTVWRWNRAVYDPAAGGHLRIEMRALPSGPTIPDMLANTAFLVGLALDLAGEIADWRRGVGFASIRNNFYRAAQLGLDAQLAWLERGGGEGVRSAREVARACVDRARRGLAAADVEASDAEPLLDLVEARLAAGMTGARWQRERAASEQASLTRDKALARMLQRYLELAESGEPVHAWPRP